MPQPSDDSDAHHLDAIRANCDFDSFLDDGQPELAFNFRTPFHAADEDEAREAFAAVIGDPASPVFWGRFELGEHSFAYDGDSFTVLY